MASSTGAAKRSESCEVSAAASAVGLAGAPGASGHDDPTRGAALPGAGEAPLARGRARRTVHHAVKQSHVGGGTCRRTAHLGKHKVRHAGTSSIELGAAPRKTLCEVAGKRALAPVQQHRDLALPRDGAQQAQQVLGQLRDPAHRDGARAGRHARLELARQLERRRRGLTEIPGTQGALIACEHPEHAALGTERAARTRSSARQAAGRQVRAASASICTVPGLSVSATGPRLLPGVDRRSEHVRAQQKAVGRGHQAGTIAQQAPQAPQPRQRA